MATGRARHFPPLEATTRAPMGEEREREVAKLREFCASHIPKLAEEMRTHFPPDALEQADSERGEDYRVYTGAAGNALYLCLLARYYAATAPDLVENTLKRAWLAISTAESAMRAESTRHLAAFFCGASGVLAVKAMIASDMGREAEAAESLQRVVAMEEQLRPEKELDLLYGRAGYLYSLLLLRRQLPALAARHGVDDAVRQAAAHLLRDASVPPSAAHGHTVLRVSFPAASSSGRHYFGAAHGLAGVLFVLMHVPQPLLDKSAWELVRSEALRLARLQDEAGNFPSSEEHIDNRQLVQWCHGAPGFLPMLCRARELFGDTEAMDAARKAAAETWRLGLLRKGLGLCHGIGGNALALMAMFRMTGDTRYWWQALKFCEFALKHSEAKGQPDAPYSLMEGLAGFVVALTGVCTGDACFPGYDGLI